jgi:hypothetical protein
MLHSRLKKKLQNASAARKQWLENFCVFLTFTASTIHNPTSPSPWSDVFETLLTMCKASLLQKKKIVLSH